MAVSYVAAQPPAYLEQFQRDLLQGAFNVTKDPFPGGIPQQGIVGFQPLQQAAISGTRPIVDRSSLAYPVSVSMAELEQPYLVDRDRWLVEICHTEYTLNEIQRGIWLKRIAQYL